MQYAEAWRLRHSTTPPLAYSVVAKELGVNVNTATRWVKAHNDKVLRAGGRLPTPEPAKRTRTYTPVESFNSEDETPKPVAELVKEIEAAGATPADMADAFEAVGENLISLAVRMKKLMDASNMLAKGVEVPDNRTRLAATKFAAEAFGEKARLQQEREAAEKQKESAGLEVLVLESPEMLSRFERAFLGPNKKLEPGSVRVLSQQDEARVIDIEQGEDETDDPRIERADGPDAGSGAGGSGGVPETDDV